jgi:predicted HAD superfamily hydrolase
MSNTRIYSFDIFDTCLSRTTGLPSGVFYLMAKTVMPIRSGRHLLYEFVNARRKAERMARMETISGKKEDVSLEEIYAHFDMQLDGFSRERLMELELQTEASVLRPIHTTAEMIRNLRSEGARIIFVSDIYLPETFVRDRLLAYGLFEDGDGLYVSSSVGLMKATGHLFDHVGTVEKVPLSSIRHFGDHEYSDLRVPLGKGIQARLVDTAMNRYEYAWNNNAHAHPSPFDIYFMSGISRSVRLGRKPDVHDSIITNAIAALFVPFVHWILSDAQQRGIRRLYFLARDGYVLYEIAKILGAHYPDIVLRYLYGSRRAFYLAGVRDGSREEMQWIFPPVYGKTPRQMLKRINADVELITPAMARKGVSPEFPDVPLTHDTFPLFLELLDEEGSRNALLRLAASQRSVVRDYFRQEGLCDDVPCGIVDIGWSRFCQRSMNVILEPNNVFGYFFGVFDERVSVADAGDFASLFYPEEFYDDRCNRNLLTQEFLPVLEQFFTLNDQQSTKGFTKTENGIVPDFEEKKGGDERRLGYFQKHLSLIREFSGEYLPFMSMIGNPELLVRHCGYRSVNMLMTDPLKEEAGVFHDFMVDNGLGDPVPLVKKVGLGELFKKAILGRAVTPEYIWTEGTMAFSFGEHGLNLLKMGRKLKANFRNRQVK